MPMSPKLQEPKQLLAARALRNSTNTLTAAGVFLVKPNIFPGLAAERQKLFEEHSGPLGCHKMWRLRNALLQESVAVSRVEFDGSSPFHFLNQISSQTRCGCTKEAKYRDLSAEAATPLQSIMAAPRPVIAASRSISRSSPPQGSVTFRKIETRAHWRALALTRRGKGTSRLFGFLMTEFHLRSMGEY